jgi:hypothetical protein
MGKSRLFDWICAGVIAWIFAKIADSAWDVLRDTDFIHFNLRVLAKDPQMQEVFFVTLLPIFISVKATVYLRGKTRDFIHFIVNSVGLGGSLMLTIALATSPENAYGDVVKQHFDVIVLLGSLLVIFLLQEFIILLLRLRFAQGSIPDIVFEALALSRLQPNAPTRASPQPSQTAAEIEPKQNPAPLHVLHPPKKDAAGGDDNDTEEGSKRRSMGGRTLW